MHRRESLRVSVSIVVCASLASCERPNSVEAVHVTYDLTKLDQEKFPPATKRLFDAVVAKTLAGAAAKDYQADLDTAQKMVDQNRAVAYMFQLDQFDQPFEKILDEGVPYLFVRVQKKYGLIFHCGISKAEF